MNEFLTLVGRVLDDDGYNIKKEIRRDVFCRLESVGRREFYLAQTAGLQPEFKFVLPDHLDYSGEYLCIYDSDWYRVVRTYRKGQELELVVQRASVEDIGEVYKNC